MDTHQSFSLFDRSLISVGVFNYYLPLVCAWQVLVDKEKIYNDTLLTRKVKSKCLLPSNEKWELQYTHMFRTFTLRTKRSTCICVYVKSVWCSCIKWENNFDCSSRQTHFWLFLWWKGVSYKTTNVSKENDDNAFVHLSTKKDDDDNDYQQFYSLFIMFEWEPSSS